MRNVTLTLVFAALFFAGCTKPVEIGKGVSIKPGTPIYDPDTGKFVCTWPCSGPQPVVVEKPTPIPVPAPVVVPPQPASPAYSLSASDWQRIQDLERRLADLDTVKSQNTALQSQLTAAQNQLSTAQTQLTASQNDLAAAKSSIESLHSQLTAVQGSADQALAAARDAQRLSQENSGRFGDIYAKFTDIYAKFTQLQGWTDDAVERLRKNEYATLISLKLINVIGNRREFLFRKPLPAKYRPDINNAFEQLNASPNTRSQPLSKPELRRRDRQQ